MNKWNAVDWIAFILLIVGGLNWGIVGFFGIDIVASLFGDLSGFTRFVYALAGLAALYVVVMPTFFTQEVCVPCETLESPRR